jgi:hypothetical protein
MWVIQIGGVSPRQIKADTGFPDRSNAESWRAMRSGCCRADRIVVPWTERSLLRPDAPARARAGRGVVGFPGGVAAGKMKIGVASRHLLGRF